MFGRNSVPESRVFCFSQLSHRAAQSQGYFSRTTSLPRRLAADPDQPPLAEGNFETNRNETVKPSN